MPLVRTSLYGLGENIHVAVWPGSDRNTNDITRFIAKESRSYVISVSGFMRTEDIPKDIPHRDKIIKNAPDILANGGSCIAAPDGNWVTTPVIDREDLIIAEIDFNRILQERQNFDVAGHYSRPDVTKLMVNRERQSIINIIDS
jgi:nitrilase